MTTVIHDPREFQRAMDSARAEGRSVGFVPTMGALHEGHLTLAREARARVGERGLVALSIFVNPTQFGPNEDFSNYPRELDVDVARCQSAGVDVVFAPAADAMYPKGERTRVQVHGVSAPLCGPFRPGHFEGVATIVTKLFALAGRCVAVFGRKDYQQWRVLSRLAEDLMLPVEIVGVRTVRERDGLAMSSRNRYLSAEDRAKAAEIPKALGRAARAWQAGERDANALRSAVERALEPIADSIDYVDVRDPESLEPYEPSPSSDRALLAIAIRLGKTRLIDNIVLGEEPPPA
jgi:pantoate--beta-alanine ligase